MAGWAFEDSRKGDYDYNDLIIHVSWSIRENSYTIAVQPIALGSSKKISWDLRKWMVIFRVWTRLSWPRIVGKIV